MSAEILIVDDNTDIRNIINELIQDAGYKTRIAANYNQALAEIDKKLPDVAILDVKLDKGDNDGIELLSHIKTKNKDVPVIIISGHANIEMAIKSLHHGAFEFIEKPFDQERLLNFVSRAVENFNLKTQNREYENKLFSSYELIGDSKNTINIIEQINKISLTESRVFIHGPSGSGKELVARKIHKNSSRKKKPIYCFKWSFTRLKQV
jgi:two-component system nitrogen regulation response regulator NtrX